MIVKQIMIQISIQNIVQITFEIKPIDQIAQKINACTEDKLFLIKSIEKTIKSED